MEHVFAKLGIPTLILAVIYAVCCHMNMTNFGYMIAAAAMAVYTAYSMRVMGYKLKKGSVFLGAAAVLLGISGFVTDNSFIQATDTIGSLLLLVAMLIHTRFDTSQWTLAKGSGGFWRMVGITFVNVPAPFKDLKDFRATNRSEGAKRFGIVGKIVIGIVISIPLIAVIIGLLYSADEVFADIIRKIFLDNFNFKTIFGMIFLFGLCFIFAYAAVRGMSSAATSETEKEKKLFDPAIAITMLSLINVIYILFCVIQFKVLFAKKLPEGMTYSQYAHEGFYQLILVCALNLILVLILCGIFRRNIVTKVLLIVTTLCTYIMLVSCAYRMGLYTQAYGLTLLRVLVFWGVGVLAILFAGVILQILRDKFKLLHYFVVVITVCYVVLSFSRPDYWIANYDLNYSQKIDYSYLWQLSADAEPVLRNVHGIDEIKKYQLKMKNIAADDNYRTFNLSRWLAQKASQ